MRLGTDKGLFRPLEDESLVLRGVRLWSQYFAEVLIVVHDEDQADLYRIELQRLRPELRRKLKIVCDCNFDIPCHRSPLSGILTGMLATNVKWLAVVAVDQLGVRAHHFRQLVKHVNPHKPAAFFDEDWKVFPSIWPVSVSERLLTLALAGSLSIKRALTHFESIQVVSRAWGKLCDINGNDRVSIREAIGSDPLFDPYKRRMHYLRFSLTEACNLSCTYCLPEGYPEWYRHKAKLGLSEIKTLLQGFLRLGFRKVRFTGGEPTVHPQCLKAIEIARDLGFEEIALTTNGLLIRDIAMYQEAGLTQINYSMDSIRPETFKSMTGSSGVEALLSLIDRSIEIGLKTKVNTVLLRSKNGREVDELIDWALGKELTLRFIELMPTGLNKSFFEAEHVSGSEIEKRLVERSLNKKKRGYDVNLSGPEVVWNGAHKGQIGLINPLSCNFCDACNRLRVTAKGALKLCLFGDFDPKIDTSSPLRVAESVRKLVAAKKERHHLEEGHIGNVETFRNIGG